MEAQKQLEELVLDRDTMDVKKDIGNRMAQSLYTKENGSHRFAKHCRLS